MTEQVEELPIEYVNISDSITFETDDGWVKVKYYQTYLIVESDDGKKLLKLNIMEPRVYDILNAPAKTANEIQMDHKALYDMATYLHLPILKRTLSDKVLYYLYTSTNTYVAEVTLKSKKE